MVRKGKFLKMVWKIRRDSLFIHSPEEFFSFLRPGVQPTGFFLRREADDQALELQFSESAADLGILAGRFSLFGELFNNL